LDSELWLRIISGIEVDARRYWGAYGSIGFYNLRDEEMGRNLKWLLKEVYPDRRIIIWTANTHAGLNYESAWYVGRGKGHGFVPMGWYVRKELGRKVYSLGFISSQGKRGFYREVSHSLPELKKGDLEYWLHKTSLEIAALRLRNLPPDPWLTRPIVTHPIGSFRMKGIWSQSFDGLFYIRHMTPSTPLEPATP
jgi:erythromycin esterase